MQYSLINNKRSFKLLIVIMVLGLLAGCKREPHFPPNASEESADVVYAWYKFVAKLQLPSNPQPVVLVNLRNFSYIGVGLYEAVRPGIKGSVSLSSRLYQMPHIPDPDMHKDYLWSASANAALASMFKQFLAGLSDADRASIDSLENANNNRFRLSISDDVLYRSQSFGRSVATTIYNWSTTDNFNLSSVGYTLPVFPGAWVPTPPGFVPPLGPFLKDSRPFLSYSLTATAPPLPFPYSEDPSSDFYAAAKEVYDIGKALTEEQKAIANWFSDVGGPGVGVPAPYHLLSIITGVLESQGAKLGKAAEIYAKTGIAQKDGPFIIWKSKYQFNLLRPITYIQMHIDPSWQSYLINPPYPDYLSGLAGLYSPVMQVLTREFGDIPVTDNAYDWRGLAPRYYPSLTALVEDVAICRVYGGIHYRFTQNITVAEGRKLGNKIADINLVNYKH